MHENTDLHVTVDSVPRTTSYDVVVRYQKQSRGDWQVARITVVRPDEYNPHGPCANSHPSYEDRIQFSLPEQQTSVVALSNVCLEEGKVYKVKLTFERQRLNEDNAAAQILIDSVNCSFSCDKCCAKVACPSFKFFLKYSI